MELPSTNIKKNFPGVDETAYYTMADLIAGDCGGSEDFITAPESTAKKTKPVKV